MCVYIYTHTYVYVCVCVCIYVYVYIAVVIVDVGTVNGLMLWWLVWLANRANDTIKTRVDTREITYCYLSMCIDALYRNPLMYAEPQWSGCRSACKLLVELVSHKKRLISYWDRTYISKTIFPVPVSIYHLQSTFLCIVCTMSVSRIWDAIWNMKSNLVVTHWKKTLVKIHDPSDM